MSPNHSKTIVAFAFLTIIFGIPSLLLAIYMISTKPSDQMHELRSYEGDLVNIASAYVDSFIGENHRPPNDAEFDKWVSSQEHDNSGLSGYGFYITTSKYPKDLTQHFGHPPINGYVINFWTGDVTASYVSWSPQRNSAYVPDNEYFPFGSQILSVTLFLAIPIFLVIPLVNAVRQRALQK
jgi:hypothetical protein